MTSQPLNLEDKIKFYNSVLNTKAHRDAVDTALTEADGDMTNALKSLETALPEASLKKVALAHVLEDWSERNTPIVKALVKKTELTSLRDIALNYNIKKLAAIVDAENLPETIAGMTPDEKKQNFAVALHQKLFTTQTSAVLQRMVQDAEIPIADKAVRAGIASFLNNQPDFNIRTTSIYTALKHPEAFKDIAAEHHAGIVDELKTLQRVQSLSPIPEAIPLLIEANLTSAFAVGEMPESSFLKAHGEALGEETALQVYTIAINSRIRNEQALMTMRESIRGTGLAILDRDRPMQTRMAKVQAPADIPDAEAPAMMEMLLPDIQAPEDLADAEAPKMKTRLAMMQAVVDRQEVPVPLNLEALFGDMDFCECEECTSVYSPTAYFVELLQYLRNNNLDPKKVRTDPKDISDTPLEKLFRRRPDLGCLELTCKNTFTVLPYIDLVNEVMESFVVHLDEYDKSNTDPNQRKARLDTFNVDDETTSELLAEPQHTNYHAYCILKSAVYPFTLPYHQPIDATRIFLKYLGTSRYKLLDVYRSADDACANAAFTPAQQIELKKIHGDILDRAVDAEFLGMTQEEYIILTKEAFWPKRYFDITLGMTHSEEEYRQKIGVKPVHEYYGYIGKDAEKNMLSTDETQKLGLTFVKKQFLPRTGIQYIDLVEILKTQFINPNFPQGKALTILESIRFSYRFLQTLVDTTSTDPKIRFAKLVGFLEKAQPLVPLLDAYLHPDPCQQQKPDWCLVTKDLRNWVYCYFERIGKLIVLEAGEGLRLPIEGDLFTEGLEEGFQTEFVGTLRKDGTIVDKNGRLIGNVKIDSTVVGVDGQAFINQFKKDTWLQVRNPQDTDNPIGFVDPRSVLVDKGRETPVKWLPAQDTCDLDKVRLVHLDGSVLTIDEYDRFQRFIRLWRKLGWTIDETDKALVGLSAIPSGSDNGTPTNPEHCEPVGFDVFSDDCPPIVPTNGGCNDVPKDPCDDGSTKPDSLDCPKPIEVAKDITPAFLHQLVAVIKLLDRTGLPLIKLLAFWTEISTIGEKSLYKSLFLTHNLLAHLGK